MSVEVNKLWWAEYARAEKERQGADPDEVHRYAVKCANEKRRKYEKNHGR